MKTCGEGLSSIKTGARTVWTWVGLLTVALAVFGHGIALSATAGNVTVSATAVDGSGNSYVTGFFFGDATFGVGEPNQTTLAGCLSIFGFDAAMFIAKYNLGGALEWVKRAYCRSSGRASTGVRSRAIAVDTSGNSYVTGAFTLGAIFGEGQANATELTSVSIVPTANHSDIFIAKYNASGALQWAKGAGGLFDDVGNAIEVDGSGNSYVRGTYNSPATFGAGEANQTTLGGFGSGGFLAKYNASGLFQWVKRAGAAGAGPVDLDGDGKSDIGIYRDGAWSLLFSSNGLNDVRVLGVGGWVPVPGDYDRDGNTDIAVYKDGEWYWIRSSDGATTKVGWGGPDWEPVPADYDGDGQTDVALYNPSIGYWSIVRSTDGRNDVVNFGGPGWIAVPADYDGDGKADVAVYHQAGVWSILRSSDGGNTVVGHGGSGFEPVPADYDGDGKADMAVHAGGAWSILRSSLSALPLTDRIAVVIHGGPGWTPVPADYDGDGAVDVAVYHSMGAWSIKRSSDGAIQVVGHGGGPTDVPLN